MGRAEAVDTGLEETAVRFVEIRAHEAEAREPEGAGNRWRPCGTWYLPLEQVERDTVVPAVAGEDPRVPLRLLESERLARLRSLRRGVRALREPEDVAVERERSVQVRAVHIQMEHPRHTDRHRDGR